MRLKLFTAGLLIVASVAALGLTGHLPLLRKPTEPRAPTTAKIAPAIAVTVAKAITADLVEVVLVTGSLVPREEILIGPEVEGLRITEVLADEGDRVKKGQSLARLVSDTIETQLAQNDAAQARARAGIAQAKSNIAAAEARLVEASNAYNRAKPLTKSGVISESGMDQRTSAAKTAEANLAAAKDGLALAEADLAQAEAQRREFLWRRGRTEVVSPADGIVSRRVARVGGFAAGASEPMFRIVAKGEVELDAEVTETRLAQLRVGQTVEVEAAGAGRVKGTIRIVSPEIDKATRLGRIRVFIGDNPSLRVGAFATGIIETARSRGLAVPISAVQYVPDGGATVQVVIDGKIVTRGVKLGLAQGKLIEVREGLNEGDAVVAKAGTFLRDGDSVRPVTVADPRVGSAG
ncbi:MAG: efflux RND transporter periplasmic adaptor subunit [Hyphomicrobiaceae bacterium]